MKTESMATVDKIVTLVGGWFNVVAAVIISGLICAVWVSHGGWFDWIRDTIIGTIPTVAVLAGLERVKINGKTTKMLPRGVAIIVILLMVVVWNLHEAEWAETRRIADKSMNEYYQSVDYMLVKNCRDACDKTYGFSIYKPSTWHIGENRPLKDCYRDCRR